MKKRRFLKFVIPISLVAVLAVSIPLMSSCRPAPPKEVEPIKFLMVFPYSGLFGASAWGGDRGATLAVEDINARGGVLGRPLELLRFDVVNWEAENLVAAREYGLAQGVDMFETYFGVEALITEFDANKVGGIPCLQWHTTEPFAELIGSDLDKYWNQVSFDDTSRLYAPNAYLGYTKWLPETFGYDYDEYASKTVAILSSDLAYSVDISERFRALIAADPEWEEAYFSEFPFGSIEFGAQLAEIRALDPEPGLIMFIEVSGTGSASFVMQFLTDPTNSLIHIQWGIGEADFHKAMGKDSEGVMGQGQPVANPTKEHAEFAKRVYQRWQVSSHGGEPAHYDYISLWAEAIEAVGDVKDYEAIIDYIVNTPYTGKETPYGAAFTFGPDGSNISPYTHNDRVEVPILASYAPEPDPGDYDAGPGAGNNLHLVQSKFTSLGSWPVPLFINGVQTEEYMQTFYGYPPQTEPVVEVGTEFELPPWFK